MLSSEVAGEMMSIFATKVLKRSTSQGVGGEEEVKSSLRDRTHCLQFPEGRAMVATTLAK